jgi:hypothetical protein
MSKFYYHLHQRFTRYIYPSPKHETAVLNDIEKFD